MQMCFFLLNDQQQFDVLLLNKPLFQLHSSLPSIIATARTL